MEINITVHSLLFCYISSSMNFLNAPHIMTGIDWLFRLVYIG